jgi:hypothetical protein
MLFFALAYTIAETILTLVAIFQFFAALFTGSVNVTVQRFGHNLSLYAYQILQFETFNDETLPFPFTDWPDEDAADSTWVEETDQPGTHEAVAFDEGATVEPSQAGETTDAGDDTKPGV